MFRRHVDFFAVSVITLALLAVSELSAFRVPLEPIRVENISTQVRACQISNQIAARIVNLLIH